MEHTLIKQNAKGNTQFWKICVKETSIHIEWGVENGKFQTNTTTIQEGKQKRSKEEQALFEAKSLIDKKLRTGYMHKDQKQVSKSPLPMLAKEYSPRLLGDNVVVAIQPKLDGIRCMANVKTGELWSRKQTRIQGLEYISKLITQFKFPDHVTWLDGELYTHNYSFNEISSKVRRTKNFTDSLDIQYWVYDCITSKPTPFSERFKTLKNSIYETKQCILTPTTVHILTTDLVETKHKEAISDNYEGIMVRKIVSLYETGKRSSNLLKYKDCQQEEFEVIGFKQKKVVNDVVTLGSVILKCYKDDSIVFNASPTMTNEEKQEIWNNQNDYLGQIATVKFFEKTPKGIPRFPRLIGFRHPDDC